MPSAYRIKKEAQVAFKVLVGRITREELFALDRQFLTDPDLPPGVRLLTDVALASFEGIGEKEFNELIALYQEHRGKVAGVKMAIVTTQDFRKARLYERMVASVSINVIVFNQLDHACTWLGIGAEEAQTWISAKRAQLLSAA